MEKILTFSDLEKQNKKKPCMWLSVFRKCEPRAFGGGCVFSILTIMKRKLSVQEPTSKRKKKNVESPKNFWFQMLKELKQLGYKSDLPNSHRA
jgi:hypothetical protein